MRRFRLLQVCNRNDRAHLWVCPWLRDEACDPFDEYIVKLKYPVKTMAGVEFFVDIKFETKEVAITPVGSMQWVWFTPAMVDTIEPPELQDYKNLERSQAPALPWVFNSDFSPPD